MFVASSGLQQKKFYDAVLISGVAAYLAIFGVLTKNLFPHVTDEIMLMRAFGMAAFLLLQWPTRCARIRLRPGFRWPPIK